MTEVIYLQFGSVAFSIDPRDITWLPVDVNQPMGRCLSSITGSAIDDKGTWLIGDPFLKNVYMVTDTGNNKIHLSGREGTQTTSRGAQVARNGQSLREGDGNGQYFLLYGQNDMIRTMRLMDTATYCLSIVIYLYYKV
ncbi:hypothetical protein HD553DRAFT_319746, partial [Filobasidium floriforme]|uniref:uncharacterized protein n=1 Tax=Filobasidium floriforme TaxID=5210 RepID=UPI001E8CE02D